MVFTLLYISKKVVKILKIEVIVCGVIKSILVHQPFIWNNSFIHSFIHPPIYVKEKKPGTIPTVYVARLNDWVKIN